MGLKYMIEQRYSEKWFDNFLVELFVQLKLLLRWAFCRTIIKFKKLRHLSFTMFFTSATYKWSSKWKSLKTIPSFTGFTRYNSLHKNSVSLFNCHQGACTYYLVKLPERNSGKR